MDIDLAALGAGGTGVTIGNASSFIGKAGKLALSGGDAGVGAQLATGLITKNITSSKRVGLASGFLASEYFETACE